VTALLALLLALPPSDPGWAVEALIDPTLGFLTVNDLIGPCISPLLPRITIGGLETSLLDPSVLSLAPFRRVRTDGRALDFEPAHFEEETPLTTIYLRRGTRSLTELGTGFGRGLLGGRVRIRGTVDYREIVPFAGSGLDYQHAYSAAVAYHEEPWLLSGFILAADRKHPDLDLRDEFTTALFAGSFRGYSLSLGFGRNRGTHPFEEIMGRAEADIGPITATFKGRRTWAKDLKDDRGSIEVAGWFDLGRVKVKPAVHFAHSEMFDGGPGVSLTLKGFRSRIEAFYGRRFPELTMLTNDDETWIPPNPLLTEEAVLEVNATFGTGFPVFLDVHYLKAEDMITWNQDTWIISWNPFYCNLHGTPRLLELTPKLDLPLPLGLEISGAYILRLADELEYMPSIPQEVRPAVQWFRDSDGRLRIEETIPLKSGDVMLGLHGELLYFGASDFADPQSLFNTGASLDFFESVNISLEVWNLADEDVYTNELYPLSSRRYTVRISARLWD
jgi:hypothetical protein